MSKYDFFAEVIDINDEELLCRENNRKFLNLKYGNLYKRSKILNKFKGKEYFEYSSFIVDEDRNYFETIKQISGIYENPQNLQTYINKLPKYSFAIWCKFKLIAPYFSKDDDEFYIIQNPILKETNFKVPMIRGSSWKGALAHAFRESINKETNIEEVQGKIESFLRIFGAGSEIIKELEKYIKNKSKSFEEFKEKFIDFVLFELGMEINEELIQNVDKAKNYKDVSDILAEKVRDKYEDLQENLPVEFQTHRGRAIFYPTYFNRLSLEIINPHDRRKRAGINPIHYEVVPTETEGIFQLIYIPFDGVLNNEEELGEEAKEDLRNLVKALEILKEKGVGAKTKLGWGRFEILEIYCFKNW